LLLVLVLALVACEAGVPATAGVSTATLAPASTIAAASPTAPPVAIATLPAVAPTAGPSPTAAATTTPAVAPTPPITGSGSSELPTPWPIPAYVTQELAAFFADFYRARTLQPGGALDTARTLELTAWPFRYYTVSLLERDQADADAGRLISVTYSDIATAVADWQPQPNGTGSVVATVTRTIRETRATGARAPQTATLRFKLTRYLVGESSAAWVVWDFYDQAVGAWVSQGLSFGGLSPEQEVAAFFRQFYAAREVQAGGPFDPTLAIQQNNFAYAAYQRPQLERQRDEVARGELISVAYSDIQIALISWDPRASQHGGMATVEVTRTRRVVRPGGSETTRETLHFRVHRHLDNLKGEIWEPRDGEPLWYAIDFRDPGTGRWVSAGGWEWRNGHTTDPLPIDDFFG
jgi:hypothetical protein